MPTLTQPGPTARQVSAKNVAGESILAVFAKRAYRIVPGSRCAALDETPPLVEEPVQDPENDALLLQDCEMYGHKLATDVVIKGHAYAPRGQRRFEAKAQIGKAVKTILVLGPRKCTRAATGKLVFSEPGPVEKIPLRYSHAYGGHDTTAEAKNGNPAEPLQRFFDEPIDLVRASPYQYPRNPAGVGYLIEQSAESLEKLQLPNLEDPLDPLTPERLLLGSYLRWPTMPLPQATDWIDYDWFPRIAYSGIVVPSYEPPKNPIAEVTRGYAPADVLVDKPIVQKQDWLFTSGASLGLQLPYLRGDEAVELTNMHAKQQALRFTLPGERPKISTDGRKGKLNPTEPVLHSVVIEPDAERVTVVWCGAARALRPYRGDELAKMPFRIEW